MKTSFYFVLWTVIYPLLGLIPSETVRNNGFLFALVAVFGISWLLRKAMPGVFAYEAAARRATYLEPVYRGDVGAFRRLVHRDALVESVSAAYFVLSTVYILITCFTDRADWFDLAVFGLLLWASASRAASLVKADRLVSGYPTPDNCAKVAEETYRYDYPAYRNAREHKPLAALMPPRPRAFGAFTVVSMIFAVLSVLCGGFYLFIAFGYGVSRFTLFSGAFSGMLVLYGLLAIYFGVRDIMGGRSRIVTE